MDDDLGLAWPFWKFGLKRSDLFTKLHDQYNTIPSSIQDPEAFHHDVFEISTEASSTEEFHRLMADRKQQRLRELNSFLESASVEIIANPSLIGTQQWQHALQLFRTRSLDSLVRYFASYLPTDHPWHRSDADSISSDPESVDSMTHSDHNSFLDDHHDVVYQPFVDDPTATHLPPSPRSMTMYSGSSVASQGDLDDHHDFVLTPARTMSFSESEPDHFPLEELSFKDSCPLHHDDLTQSSDADTPVSSVSDASETHQEEMLEREVSIVDDVDDDGYPGPQHPFESETPTPKPEPEPTAVSKGSACSFFFEGKPSPLSSFSTTRSARHRSVSPSRNHLSSHRSAPLAAVDDLADCGRKLRSSSPRLLRRLDQSPAGKGRRSACEGGSNRVQKSTTDHSRSRPRGRRRAGGAGGLGEDL